MSAGAWWDAFAEAGGLPDLETWLGGVDAASRVRIRERIAECHYETVLDCGAGLGLDWIGIDSNLSHEVTYQGIEPSTAMVDASITMARDYGRDKPPIIGASIEQIPFNNKSFDLVYARHILEHLPRFETALGEMCRVASLEVIVVFFMRPGKETYLFRERDGLWQNRYAKDDIVDYLLSIPGPEVWFWETLEDEVLLHIYMEHTLKVDPEKVAQRLV